jgi:lycopene beta-cyclase
MNVHLRGFGLAGACFALALKDRARLSIDDPHSTLAHDRQLCFFETDPHLLAPCVVQRWHALEVGNRAGVRTRVALPHPYARIPAPAILAYARRALGPDSFKRLPPEQPDLILDSRPKPLGDCWRQSFVGYRVRAAFDSSCVTLMDFAIEQPAGALRFVYVLPYGANDALVEDTWLHPPDRPFVEQTDALINWITRRFGTPTECSECERGSLPLDPTLKRGGGVGAAVEIGTRGGFLRASSGYSTADTLRAAALATTDPVALRRALKRLRPRLSDAMDGIFLRALARDPHAAADWFCTLIADTAPATWIAFLNGTATLRQHVEVMRALPAWPMLKALQ